jgi:hypothetical protein
VEEQGNKAFAGGGQTGFGGRLIAWASNLDSRREAGGQQVRERWSCVGGTVERAWSWMVPRLAPPRALRACVRSAVGGGVAVVAVSVSVPCLHAFLNDDRGTSLARSGKEEEEEEAEEEDGVAGAHTRRHLLFAGPFSSSNLITLTYDESSLRATRHELRFVVLTQRPTGGSACTDAACVHVLRTPTR